MSSGGDLSPTRDVSTSKMDFPQLYLQSRKLVIVVIFRNDIFQLFVDIIMQMLLQTIKSTFVYVVLHLGRYIRKVLTH